MSDEWAVVRTVGTDEEAALIAGYLRSCEVPTQVESLLFHQEPVNFGRLGEVRVRVPAERADEARRLLAERDDLEPLADGDGDDDDAGDAGDSEPEGL
jgi:hypothetical protein